MNSENYPEKMQYCSLAFCHNKEKCIIFSSEFQPHKHSSPFSAPFEINVNKLISKPGEFGWSYSIDF